MSNGLTNNQSHELKLWEIFLARLKELEILHELERLKVKPVEYGFSIAIGGTEYVICLPPTEYPLRVTIAQGDEEAKTLPFKETRTIILQAIKEIEEQISWSEDEIRLREVSGGDKDDQPWDEPEEEEEFHEVCLSDGPCGLVIYE